MNDFERNCRTLIISFVIALLALIPLRFIEVNNQESTLYGGRNQVLGDEVEIYFESEREEVNVDEELVKEDGGMGIVLPDSDIHYLLEERIY